MTIRSKLGCRVHAACVTSLKASDCVMHPRYRLSHPEYCLFPIQKTCFLDVSTHEIVSISFENEIAFSDEDVCMKIRSKLGCRIHPACVTSPTGRVCVIADVLVRSPRKFHYLQYQRTYFLDVSAHEIMSISFKNKIALSVEDLRMRFRSKLGCRIHAACVTSPTASECVTRPRYRLATCKRCATRRIAMRN